MTAEQDRIRDEFRAALDAGNGTTISVGRTVICDRCNTDMTDDPRSGGLLFSGKAIGPCCSTEAEKSIRGYREQRYIRGHCPQGVSFADWVRAPRGPDAQITVRGGRP